jgi:orotate phosphoribosyltransferase
MPQPRHPRLAEFVRAKAIKVGQFRLASGGLSTYYCDGKMVSFAPEGALLIADAILEEIDRLGGVDAVGGMDMGATPIVSAVALRSHQRGKPLPSFVVRKGVKTHGTMKEIEGPIPQQPSRVVVVDDVVTTAGSVIQAIDAVRRAGHTVVLAISVLDRESGGARALEAIGVPYQPLVTISELGISAAQPAASGR